MITKDQIIDNNSESIFWHEAEKRVIKQLMEKYGIELLEWVKLNAKYCEPDGCKDENGLGEILTSKQILIKSNI